MTDLSFLLHRMNQQMTDPATQHQKETAAATLMGLLVLLGLAALL